LRCGDCQTLAIQVAHLNSTVQDHKGKIAEMGKSIKLLQAALNKRQKKKNGTLPNEVVKEIERAIKGSADVFKRYRLRSNQKLRMFIKEGKPNNDVFSSLIKDSVLWDEIWDEEWTYDILELVNSKVEDCEEGSAAHKILVRNVTKKN